MASQCVGPSLDVDDGVLDVRLAGNPANAVLPSTGNGLRLDSSKGLWAPYEHTSIAFAKTREDSPGTAGLVATGNQKLSGVLSLEVENPSPERAMLLFVNFEVKLVHNIAAATEENAGYTGWSLLFGWDIDAAGSLQHEAVITRRDHGVPTEIGLVHTVSKTTSAVVDAGESTVLRCQSGLKVFDYGYGRYIHTYMRINGIGVTQ